MRDTRNIFLSFLIMCCFNVNGQSRIIEFKNEYYGLSDGIHSFLLIEDPNMDSMFVLKQDTSSITGLKFFNEPITYSKIYRIISEIKTDQTTSISCASKELSDSGLSLRYPYSLGKKMS